MLAYVPVRFDLYSGVAPRLRWTLMNLVAFADRAGKCWPSVRKLATVTGLGKSTVSRHLAALERSGVVTRRRRPGGCYSYVIDSRFLPASREVSRKPARPVPERRTEGNAREKSPAGHLDDGLKWEARLRGWRRRRFWMPFWGPKPTEPGCWAPAALLAAD